MSICRNEFERVKDAIFNGATLYKLYKDNSYLHTQYYKLNKTYISYELGHQLEITGWFECSEPVSIKLSKNGVYTDYLQVSYKSFSTESK